jgi:hypothetical protein
MTDIHEFRDKEDPEFWRVEEMDYDGRTPFAGQDAERRAGEYAEWLGSQVVKPSSVDAQIWGRKRWARVRARGPTATMTTTPDSAASDMLSSSSFSSLNFGARFGLCAPTL